MQILQEYYPERLGNLIMVNTPWYMRMVATLVWPFLDKRTWAKIQVGVKMKHVTDFIDRDQLLTSLGGTHEHAAGDPAFPPPAAQLNYLRREFQLKLSE